MFKERKRTIYDTAVSVEAGYPEKKFFPHYNGKETPHAELLSRIELIVEGEGLLIECTDGRDPETVRTELRAIMMRHRVRPPNGYRFRIRKFKETYDGPWKLLITVRRTKTQPKPSKQRTRIIIDFENRTKAQFEKDRNEELHAYRQYVKEMKELNLARAAERQRNLPEEIAKRNAEKRARQREAAKERCRKATEAKMKKKALRDARRREAREKLAEEIREKDRRLERRRKEKSERMKELHRRRREQGNNE